MFDTHSSPERYVWVVIIPGCFTGGTHRELIIAWIKWKGNTKKDRRSGIEHQSKKQNKKERQIKDVQTSRKKTKKAAYGCRETVEVLDQWFKDHAVDRLAVCIVGKIQKKPVILIGHF